MKSALITGITGQDGAYLSRLLINKGYKLYGISRDIDLTSKKYYRISDLLNSIKMYQCNLLNFEDISNIIKTVNPDEIYHLASDADVKISYETEHSTFDINFTAGLNILRAIKKYIPNSRFYSAGTSLMFGKVDKSPQNEMTIMNPTTPYGIAKVAQYQFTKMYRETYGIFACTGILYNHESPLRDKKFLPRKITHAVAEIKSGKTDCLTLGNIDTNRDWSYAGDVVLSMWKMLQQEAPRDFVIGSGKQHSIKDLLNIAFEFAELDWRDYVEIDANLYRIVDYDNLCADIDSANKILNWSPSMSFQQLIEYMTKNDLEMEFKK